MRAHSILLALTSIVLSSNGMARAAEPVLTLRLASGREFTGVIDAESAGETLVLRSSSRGMTIRRPIRWERIAAAAIDGKPATNDELRALAKEASATVSPDTQPRQQPGDRGQRTEDRGQRTVVAPPFVPVTTITFDARIANWDADVETDGLILDLMPIDAEGYLAPVSGVAEIELFAPQRRVFHHAPLSGGDTLERVERWTQVINPADLTTNGFRLKLPFGAVHPDFDTDWVASPYGLVHVRLIAPGHGTFDASQDGLRIRHWAPNRDQLELKRYPRFLPTEAVGRHN
jgi:hypothetical protein